MPGVDGVTLSVHCHDDLGLATANTLAGLLAGARQAEVTINGIGERAGNTSLEEIVMTLATRAARLGLRTGIDATQLVRASRLVSTVTGMAVQPNKAIVGANAFAHESGIHQDGMLKHEATYEIMRPESVGATQTRLVLGKHSGRAALSSRLSELGYSFDDAALDRVFARFKALADRRKSVADADLEALVLDEAKPPEELFALEGLQVGCGTQGMATATVRLRGPERARARARRRSARGRCDAAYKAIDALVQEPAELLEFSVRAVTEGIDALGEVTVRVRALAERDAAERAARCDGAARVPRARRRHGHHRRQREGVPQGAQPDGRRARPRDPRRASTPSRRDVRGTCSTGMRHERRRRCSRRSGATTSCARTTARPPSSTSTCTSSTR